MVSCALGLGAFAGLAAPVQAGPGVGEGWADGDASTGEGCVGPGEALGDEAQGKTGGRGGMGGRGATGWLLVRPEGLATGEAEAEAEGDGDGDGHPPDAVEAAA